MINHEMSLAVISPSRTYRQVPTMPATDIEILPEIHCGCQFFQHVVTQAHVRRLAVNHRLLHKRTPLEHLATSINMFLFLINTLHVYMIYTSYAFSGKMSKKVKF